MRVVQRGRTALAAWRMRTFSALLSVLFIGGLSSRAQAQAGHREVALTVAPEYAASPNFRAPNRGVGGSAAAFWGASEFVSIGTRFGAQRLFPIADAPDDHTASSVLSAFAGAALTLDVTHVIPSISVMPGVMYGNGNIGPNGARFAVRTALTVDYRRTRQWAFGAEIAWHYVADDGLGFPGYSVFALRVSRIFDPDAL